MEENKTKITAEFINNILGIRESFELPDKLMSILLNKQEKDKLLDTFQSFNFDLKHDILRDYFQEQHSNRNDLKQDYTPDCLCELLAKLAPKSDNVLDICSGTGALTISLYDYNMQIQCEELSSRSIPVLLLNLSLRGVNGVVLKKDVVQNKIECVYQLQRNGAFSDIEQIPEIDNKQFDLIISNPPYSIEWEQKQDERFSSYELPPKSKADYVFLLDGLYRLSDSGTAFFILPHGVLFRGGKEGEIRKQLVENNLIDAIIGIPDKLFLNTAIPVLILVLKKNKITKDILFIDVSKDYQKGTKQNNLSSDNIQKIVDTFHNRKTVAKYSSIATLEEIKANDYNLNIPRYVDTYEEPQLPPIEETVTDLLKLRQEIKDTERELAKFLRELQNSGDDSEQYNKAVESLIEAWEATAEPVCFDSLLTDIDINAKSNIKKLTDVATIERAVKDKIYKSGATLIELSATSGNYIYLDKDGTVEARYGVVIPNDNINGRYLFEAIGFSFPKWYSRYKTTMNIQIEALKHFEVKVYESKEIQLKIANLLETWDKTINSTIKERIKTIELKDYYLNNMFPKTP